MSDNAPITEELRDAVQRYDNFDGTSRVVLGESNFDRLCDAIDATHANLERENTKLREAVRRMHVHIKENCDTCDGWYCSNFDEDNECCVFDTMARELGVEVSDD